MSSGHDVSKRLFTSNNIVSTHFLFYFHFLSSSYLELSISQSKFSGTKTFIVRYRLFGMNPDLDISRVD